MSGEAFDRIDDVIRDPVYPRVDMALRRGRHIDRSDPDEYVFLRDAQACLEELYRRYGCELIHAPEGYFFLLPHPSAQGLGKRHLTVGEMLVGQTLALMQLDPATAQSLGVVGLAAMIARLSGLVGERELIHALNPRRRRVHDHVAHDTVREEIRRALRGLESMGFIDLLEGERIRLRAPLARFTDAVRDSGDVQQAMERLVAEGRAAYVEPVEPDGPETEAQGRRDDPEGEP